MLRESSDILRGVRKLFVSGSIKFKSRRVGFNVLAMIFSSLLTKTLSTTQIIYPSNRISRSAILVISHCV